MAPSEMPDTSAEKVSESTIPVGGGQTATVIGDKTTNPPTLHVKSRGESWVYEIRGETPVLVESTYDEPDWMRNVFSQLGVKEA